MPKSTTIMVLSAALLGATAPAALSFGFEAPINQCIVDAQQDCFDTLFTEFSRQIATLEDTALRDGYAAIPAAILLKAGMTRRAEAAARTIDDPAKRKELLAHVGSFYARAGQVEDAHRLLAEIELPYERSFLITEIALTELRDNNIAEKLPHLIDLMPPEFSDAIFAEIARGLSEDGHPKKAGEIAKLIFDPKLQAHALAHIAREFAKGGHAEMASGQLDQIRDPEFQILGRGEAGLTLHEGGHVREAKQLYDQATVIASGLDPNDPAKDGGLESIAYYLIQSGYSDDALSVIEAVNRPEIKAGLYYQLGHAHIERGETEQALGYLHAAVSIAAKDVDRYKYYTTLRETAVSFAQAGEVETALSTAQRLHEANLVAAAIKAIGDGILKTGDRAKAQDIYASIEHLDIRAAALVEFSERLNAEGQAEQSVRILRDLEAALAEASIEPDAYQDGGHLRGSSLASVSRAYVDRGSLRDGLRVALTIENTDQRLWTMIPILGAAIDARDNKLADEINDMLFAELQTHPNPGNVQSVMAYLTTLPQTLENIDRHKAYADLLTDDVSKTLLYNAIFENLTMNEKYSAAVEVHDLMPNASLKQVAIIELLKRRIEQTLTDR